MAWPSRWRRAGVGLALAASAVAWAQPASSVSPADGSDARSWLARIQDAAANRNYQGTMVSNAAGMVTSARVAHYCEGAQRYERIDALDGQARSTLRHNELVQTMWPQAKLAVIEQRDAVAAFPALPDGVTPESYELRVQGVDRVAGHEAHVLLFKPRDLFRFAQRLWVERGSGLLLRADTLGPQGEVIESSAFSELTLGAKPQVGNVLAAMRQIGGYKVVRTAVGRTQLDAEGWTLVRKVPGFRLISCVRRPIDPLADGAASGTPVLQSVFSDGLTHVSVFIEPFDADRHKPMRTALGATHTVMNRHGDWWITVMGDVPLGTVMQFAQALERVR